MLVITNLGKIVSGDIHRPFIEGDTVAVKGGLIEAVGFASEIDMSGAEAVVDAAGMTLTPGFVDSHAHPVLGDFSPRQNTVGFIVSCLHGGVTTMISAGEAHTPGRPSDPAGVKALAILAAKSSRKLRPGGVKLHGGAIILEHGLVEEDFAEMAREGVWLVGEVGLGGVKSPAEAAPMVRWAKKYGMKVMMHTGGTSIPGSSTITAQDVMQVDPDIVSHINGGPTAVSLDEVTKLIENTSYTVEIVQCGNPRAADYAVRLLKERGELGRVIIGNDSPSGTGIVALGILRTVVQLSSMSGIAPAQAIAMATGNTASVFGLNCGIIEKGREADLVLMDAPMGSAGADALGAIEAGDLPGIGMVLIDGKVVVNVSRNTPPPARKPAIKGVAPA